MQKRILCLLPLIVACNSKVPDKSSLQYQKGLAKYTDSTRKEMETNIFRKNKHHADSLSPVSLLSANVKEEKIVCKVKNRTGKRIDGIKIVWRLFDNFGDEISDAYDGVQYQETIGPYSTAIVTYGLASSKPQKLEAYVLAVHFKDSTTWSNDN